MLLMFNYQSSSQIKKSLSKFINKVRFNGKLVRWAYALLEKYEM